MLAEATPDITRTEPGLESLMVGYQQADAAAAAGLIRQVSPKLYRFLAGHSATRAWADDLLQECWLRIHRSRHTYRPGEPVLPWIYAIARHTRIDGFRRRRRIESHELAVERLPEPASPSHSRAAVPARDLSRFIDELPESQRDVLFMMKVSGMSLQEVAGATGSTIGAVKQKAHRAYEKLRQKLAETRPTGAAR